VVVPSSTPWDWTASAIPAASGWAWKEPAHPRVEFYAEQYKYSGAGGVGISTKWDSSDWRSTSKGAKRGSSIGYPGEAKYGFSSEYKGTHEGFDYYEVEVSYWSEGRSASRTRLYQYSGVDLEFGRDSDWHIGMRPVESDLGDK